MNLTGALSIQAAIVLVPSAIVMIFGGLLSGDSVTGVLGKRLLRIGVSGVVIALVLFSGAVWAAVH